MARATFTDIIFLLHRGELPTVRTNGRCLDAILVGVADHGSGAPSCATARLAASGNRQSLSAAVAAGLLAVGDDHGGAGSICMEMIAAGLRARQPSRSRSSTSAERTVDEARAGGRKLPGFGHRVHKVDPRTALLFSMARERGVAGDGIVFMEGVDAAPAGARARRCRSTSTASLAAVLHDLGFPAPFGGSSS